MVSLLCAELLHCDKNLIDDKELFLKTPFYRNSVYFHS